MYLLALLVFLSVVQYLLVIRGINDNVSFESNPPRVHSDELFELARFSRYT